MKCDKCKNKKYHQGGNFQDVVEGGDDPYEYWYCKKGHWDGEGEPEPWINCKDFEEKEND